MLDFRTETFLTVCEYMSYTKAAEILSMTQPAISGHIKYMENYYGVKLFSYENKKLYLTAQGEKLKRALQTLKHDEMRLKEEISQIKSTVHYRIGVTLSISASYMTEFIPYYIRKHDKTEISVTVANTSRLLNMLDQGQLDIVLSEGYFSKDDYEYRLISKEKMGIFCSSSYDTEKIKSLGQLFSHKLISREEGSGTRAVFEHYLNENGFSIDDFEYKCDFTDINLIRSMLMNGLGISVLYRCVCKDLLMKKKIKEILLPDFDISHDFNCLWQKGSMYDFINEKFLSELQSWKENYEK